MFLMISWVLVGAVIGSIGVAFSAIADASGSTRGDPDLGTIFFWLITTTVLGAAGGGILGRMVRQKFADNPRRLDQLAVLPLLAAAILVAYSVLKP